MTTSLPLSETIPQLLREQSIRFAKSEALVAGSHRLNYEQLYQQVLLVARGLHSLGVRSGDHVAILMGNRIEWVLSFLALQQLGAVSVGLNTWATPREMEFALAHAEVSCLISVDRFRRSDYREMLSAMQPHQERLPKLKRSVWLDADADQPAPLNPQAGEITWANLIGLASQTDESVVQSAGLAVQAEDVGMLLYTSGSTAAPKGILLQQKNWIQNSFHIGERQKVTQADRLWLAVSLFWSFGSVNAFPNLFTHGGCVVLQEHFDASQALSLIEQERCSIIYGTPNMVRALIEHPDRAHHDLSSLRSGATIGTPEQIQLAVDLGVKEICNVYGLSETYGNCAVIDANEPLSVRLHSVGKPLPGVTARICNWETSEPLPTGEVGEIRLTGPLFKAYYKDPVKTSEAFDQNGYFLTGDLGCLDEQGRLYYRGRLKEMVKSGGINIAPAEVEEALMRHPGVRTAYVIGVPHPTLDEALVAIIIPEDKQQPNLDQLKMHCQSELAAYKVPHRFHITSEDKLPLTTTGKVQKLSLHQLLV
jgi:fatty-acyl-CoA synthase